MFALPAPDEDGATTGPSAGFDVGQTVAHHVAGGEINAQFACGSNQHTDAWLSATTVPAQSLEASLGMMQAVINSVEVRAGSGERCVHLALDTLESRDGELSLGNARLV